MLCTIGAMPTAAVAATSPVQSISDRSLLERLREPRLVSFDVAQRTPVVRLAGFLSRPEQQHIHALAAEVRAEAGAWEGLATGNWRTTFLNQRLVQDLPALWARMLDAMRAADADHFGVLEETTPHNLHLRSAEYHEVLPTGALPTPKHLDYGSLVTIDLMLSSTGDFEGGAYTTLEADGSMLQHTFERGDALIFQSHKYHCVSPVTSGRRNVLVAELWEGLPRPCPQRCSDPWGACYCKYAPRHTAFVQAGKQCAYEPKYVRVSKESTADSPHFVPRHGCGL